MSLTNNSNSLVKVALPFFVLILLNCVAYSQLSRQGIPESFQLKTKEQFIIPASNLSPIDTAYLIKEDIEKAIPNRYGVVQRIEVDLKKDGVSTIIEGKGTIWMYEIKSQLTYSLGIHFSKFHLPEGATLFIYNEAHSQLAGAFTCINNNDMDQLPTAEFRGQSAIIEYFEPLNATFPGEVTIGSASQAYKNLFLAGSTRIGINCPEGSNFQDVKHAICLMTFYDTQYSYLCTGFLINNVREDGTPYFQTANHCISTSAMASTLVTYFNFENTNCLQNDAQMNQSLAGAKLKANSDYTDFTLLLLNEYPTAPYSPYYAGWDASNSAPRNGTCIHHPSGTPKCIAVDALAPTTYPFTINWNDNGVITQTGPDTHWEVNFTNGSIESGSSGSPLFNENQLVIGQLHGGTGTDNFFGKLSLSWNNYSPSSQQLKFWLDPDNTGVHTLEGIYTTRKPLARFSTDFTRVCTGAIVSFYDKSKYHVLNWYWKITPASYTFANGTNAGSKNPEVIFNSDGNYSVTLITTNANGSDSITKLNYIAAGNLNVKLAGLPADNIICGCNLSDYSLSVSGASSYTFNIERNDKINSRIVFDSIYLSLIPGQKKNGSFNSWIRVTGTQGSCSVSDSLLMQVSMPPNDDIENAIQIWPGRNKTFSNFCASVQKNEPNPVTSACYSNDSWCPLPSNTFILLRNTIWFKFIGPPDGLVTIDTHTFGFNDRIAIYEADSASQIISGNSSSFKIIAANEYRSATDSTALLEKIQVIPYKNYWLQLDGSDNATGSCTIDLISNVMEVFPNPSTGIFNIIIPSRTDGNAEVTIYTPLGKVIYSKSMFITRESNHLSFDLSSLARGMYFMQARINGTVTTSKLVLVE